VMQMTNATAVEKCIFDSGRNGSTSSFVLCQDLPRLFVCHGPLNMTADGWRSPDLGAR
jgi:hypothetical protein